MFVEKLIYECLDIWTAKQDRNTEEEYHILQCEVEKISISENKTE